jgi:hypothetical protein
MPITRRRSSVNPTILLCLLLAVGQGSEVRALELYRCTHNGAVEFRQTACPEGHEEKTEVIEQSHGISPIEPSLRLKDAPKQATVRPSKSLDKPSTETERCWKARQRLEGVERRLRAGYKASQYNGLHHKQAYYEEYLERFCMD